MLEVRTRLKVVMKEKEVKYREGIMTVKVLAGENLWRVVGGGSV